MRLFGPPLRRGIAVLFLVIHHTLEASVTARIGPRSPDWLTRIGESGVDILFVVSGFLALYASFRPQNQPPAASSFLFRRLTRIYPFYWTCLVGFIAIWFAGFLHSRDLTAGAIVKSLLLIPSEDTLMGLSWVLSYQVFFFLIFSATLPLRSRDASLTIGSGLLMLVLAVANLLPQGDLRDFFARPIIIEFCFGMLAARLFLVRNEQAPVATYWSLLAFAVLAIAPSFVPSPDAAGAPGLSRIVYWGLPAALLAITFASQKPRGSLSSRLGLLLGNASYAIYLAHFFVMIVYLKLLKETHLGDRSQTFIIPLVVAICIIAGLVAHFGIERPLQMLARSRAQSEESRVAPTGGELSTQDPANGLPILAQRLPIDQHHAKGVGDQSAEQGPKG
jgi:exopolysaccharide production protein ExoZ